MQYPTVLDLREAVQTRTPGASLQGSTIYNIASVAASTLLSKIFPRTTLIDAKLINPYVNNLRQYLAPSDINYILSIKRGDFEYRKANLRSLTKRPYHTGKYSHNIINNNSIITIDDPFYSDSGLRVAIQEFNSTADITTNSAATDLAVDIDNTQNGNAVRFNINASDPYAILQLDNLNVDISDVKQQPYVYMFMYMPDASKFRSVSLTLTTNSSADTITTSSTQISEQFENGWNLLVFKINKNTLNIDEPIISATVSIEHALQGTDTVNGVIIDNMYAADTEPIEIMYYTTNIFLGTDGIRRNKPITENDYIMLDSLAFNILIHEAALVRSMQIQAEDATFNYQTINDTLGRVGGSGLYGQYAAQYPDSAPKPTTRYYKSI